MILILIMGLFLLLLSFCMWSDGDEEISIGLAAFAILFISIQCYGFLKKNELKVPNNSIQSSITTNCETLVSKDGTVRVDIYTVHTNVSNVNAVKLEKE